MQIEVDGQLEFNDATAARLRSGHLVHALPDLGNPEPVESGGEAPSGQAAPRRRPRRERRTWLGWLVILLLLGSALWGSRGVERGTTWARAVATVLPATFCQPGPELLEPFLGRSFLGRSFLRRSFLGQTSLGRTLLSRGPGLLATWWQAQRLWIHLRSGPDHHTASLGLIGEGALLRIRSVTRQGDWIPVWTPDGRDAWVRGSLGRPLGPLPCGILRAPSRIPVCLSPDAGCGFRRSTDFVESWAIAAVQGPEGWVAVQLWQQQVAWFYVGQ